MESLEQQLSTLEQKITRLIAQYEAVREERDRVAEALATARATVQAQEEKLALQEDKIKTLQIAQGSTGDVQEEKRALKLKINEYIREIDKCIGMLNT